MTYGCPNDIITKLIREKTILKNQKKNKKVRKKKVFAIYLWSKKLPFVYRGGRGGGVFGRRSAALFPLVFQDFAGPGTEKPLPRQGLLGDMSWPL